MRNWRGRVAVATDSWQVPRFDAEEVLARARNTIEEPHRAAA
ncbi:hypothetical protein AB0N05_13485 [Nocardia sp. NPDC051030]